MHDDFYGLILILDADIEVHESWRKASLYNLESVGWPVNYLHTRMLLNKLSF